MGLAYCILVQRGNPQKPLQHNYLLVWLFLSLFVDVHVSLQVDSIDELLGTQITCNHRLPGMQQSVCLQVISTCEGWTTIITNKLLLISVPCHVSFEICTFDKCSVALCTLVSFVSWWNETAQHIRLNKMAVNTLEQLMLTTVHALMKPLKTIMKGMEDNNNNIKIIWFSPIWYLMCDLIQPLVRNSFPQNSHLYCFTSTWIALWMVNSLAVLNPFWHSWKE